MVAGGFLSRYLNGPLPYVWHHITVNKMCWVHCKIKHFLPFFLPLLNNVLRCPKNPNVPFHGDLLFCPSVSLNCFHIQFAVSNVLRCQKKPNIPFHGDLHFALHSIFKLLSVCCVNISFLIFHTISFCPFKSLPLLQQHRFLNIIVFCTNLRKNTREKNTWPIFLESIRRDEVKNSCRKILGGNFL